MSAALRPMNLGEILDRTFEIYRKRFLLFVGLAAMAPFGVLGLRFSDFLWWHIGSLTHPSREDDAFFWRILVSICYDHVRFLLSILFVPALVNSASRAAFGEPDSILNSMRVSVARWGRYISIGILKLLAAVIVPELVAAGIFLGMAYAENAAGWFKTGSNAPFLIVIAVPFAILAALIGSVGAGFSLAFPVAVIERIGALKAIRRSWVLSRNSRWRIIVACFLILVLVWSVMAGVQVFFRWVMVVVYALHHSGQTWGNSYLAGVYALNAIVIALLSALYPIAITLIYYDQRIRGEGYDIEQMMEAAGLGVAGAPASEAASMEAEPQEREA
jgi:hypothetical protein